MKEIVKKTIISRQLIESGDGIVIGLSGGADSTALLTVLCALREEMSLRLHAVHVNHMLRGALADRDEAYAKSLCQQFGVPFTSFRTDVSALAAESGKSFELVGREVRYGHFEAIRQAECFQKIAVAHHLDDQGETVMLRLIRGSGLEGLLGIRPCRGGVIVRPLFDCSRQQIEDYCAAQGLEPMVDHTNADSAYSRNFIRNEIIPRIDGHFGGSLSKQLSKTAELLAEDSDFIEFQLAQHWQTHVCETLESVSIQLEALKALHPAIGRRMIRRMYQNLAGDLIDFEQVHVTQVLALSDARGSRRFAFKGICFVAEYGKLSACKIMDEAVREPQLIIEETDHATMMREPGSRERIYVDRATLSGTLHWRHRKPGDSFIPLGMQGRKKLKDFLIDEKVPLAERDKLWLLCDDEKIVWVVGYRQNEETRVTKNTEQIIRLCLSDVVTTI